MSPTRLTEADELNFVIQQGNTDHFRSLMQSNRIPYRVAIFKAIESGSSVLFNLVKNFHPNPDVDVEMECLHAAFRGHLNIYEDIWYDEEMEEEFNPYIENMYLFHGRLDKIDLMELNIRDLITPNTIPVSVCDLIVQRAATNSCLMTGVLLAYCIHNSDHYTRLEQVNVYIMEIMLQYATQHANRTLTLFLLNQLRRTRKYTTYEYTNVNHRCMKKYVTHLSMYDDYLIKTPDDINCGKSLNAKGNTDFTIPTHNLRLTADLFNCPDEVETDMDAYVDKVLSTVNRLIDEGNIHHL